MIVKFFRHGTGGSGSVFNYLLGKDGDRPDADDYAVTLPPKST